MTAAEATVFAPAFSHIGSVLAILIGGLCAHSPEAAAAEMPTLTLLAYSLRFQGTFTPNTLFVVLLRFF